MSLQNKSADRICQQLTLSNSAVLRNQANNELDRK